jgi:transcriptional regulator with XRE-family HTH domain
MDEITIGARLRTLRRWRGKSQVELAGLAGLSPSFVSMVETGQRPLDRRSHIAALASALKVSETDLVGGPHLSPTRSKPTRTWASRRFVYPSRPTRSPLQRSSRPGRCLN